MEALREKSEKLTGYFEFLINQINSDDIKIITPSNPKERGCQLSIQVKNADKSLHEKTNRKQYHYRLERTRCYTLCTSANV